MNLPSLFRAAAAAWFQEEYGLDQEQKIEPSPSSVIPPSLAFLIRTMG